MPLRSPYLEDAPVYQRVVHGWVDAPGPDGFTITVRLVDPWVGLELEADTTLPSAYGIRAARGRLLTGAPARIDPSLASDASELAGLEMRGGFTRAAALVAGDRPGAAYLVDAAIEVARLARQVTRLPPAVVARHWAEGPVGAWRLDRLGWADLPESCYTYRAASEPLFSERPVSTAALPALYDPPPGAAGLFNRTKVACLESRPEGGSITHAMFDEVHAFQLWYQIDAGRPGGPVVVDAGSVTPRLPYVGICSDPQARIRDVIGQPLDSGLRTRLGVLIGGTTGCAQLYDLTTDLLKLLTLAPAA